MVGPKGRYLEVKDRAILRGIAGLYQELPGRETVAIQDLTTCTEQEVGYLGRAPQYLDLRRTMSVLQCPPKQEQLQGLETSLLGGVKRKARRDTRKRDET